MVAYSQAMTPPPMMVSVLGISRMPLDQPALLEPRQVLAGRMAGSPRHFRDRVERGAGDGGIVHFEIDPFRKHCLLNGLDDIGQTLEKAGSIDTYEAKQKLAQPWL